MATKSVTSTQSQQLTEHDEPWVTLVWNDPVNLMSYVTFVFQSYFGFSLEEANKRMLEVQPNGLHQRVPVFLGSKAEVEVAVGYHLRHDAA